MDHKNSQSASYAAAGVDITAGYRAVELMKKHIARTKNEGCLDDVGGFGGCFGLPIAGMEEPVLVSGTDGCGTKVKLAILMDKHDTIGIDAVAMCVNDIICVGAKPLFFLDYIACGKNVPEKIAEIVGGVAEGCVQSGAALIGGETAEHPGLMPVEDYDLAGFAVGIVDKKKIINKERMAAGDVVIALASTGIHSNGFSLCRKVFEIDRNPAELYTPREELGGKSVAEALLVPTRIYVKSILALLEKVDVKGISHITGGGFYENIPRSIPDGLCAKITKASVKVLPIFDLIAKEGNIPERDMFNTYNMGVGMSVVVPAAEAETALEILRVSGEDAYVIGEIVAGGDEKIEIV
ncbi:MAG: phosphoribosylformylglycinamidine cyclo-ligase [Eubacteriales bacterium]